MPLTQVDQGLLSSTAQYTGFKNRIINGAQVINQRNTTVTANSSTTTPFATDRWRGTNSATSTAFTMQQSSTAPAGFTYSLLCTVTNNTTPGSSGETEIFYAIEGYNVADLGLGTANAQTFTLSFWVNSSVTGTYGVGFENTAATYTYVGTYTVNAANTWEQKTITVAGSTAGTFDKTNDRGLVLRFDLGSGSSYEQAAGSWVNSGASRNRTSSCVRWVTNSGATFYITGVQLEKGSTATSFDYRPYGTELALCQRYYTTFLGQSTYSRAGVGVGVGTTSVTVGVSLPVVMRAITLTSTGPLGIYNGSSGVISVTSLAIDNPDTQYPTVLATVASGVNVAQPYQLLANNSTSARVNFSGEL